MVTQPNSSEPSRATPGRWSVRLLLVALVLAVLLPALLVFGWYLVAERQQAREQAYWRVNMARDGVARSLTSWLAEQEAVLARFAARPRVRALEAGNCDPLLREYIDVHPEFANLVLRDLAGNTLCAAVTGSPAASEVRKFEWFDEALKAKAFRASDAFLGHLKKQWVSVLTYPVRNDAGQVTGLLALPVDLLQLNHKLLGAMAQDVLVVVGDRQGKVLLRSDRAWELIGQSLHAGSEQFSDSAAAGPHSAGGRDGATRLLADARIAGAQWRVVAGVSESAALADSNHTLGNALVVAAVLLVLALGLAWRIGQRLARPIGQLAELANRVAAGDVTLRAVPGTGVAEVAAVALQFNGMLDARVASEMALRQSEARLRELLEHLPAGVVVHGSDSAIVASNPMASALLHLSAEQLSGRLAIDGVWRFLRSDGTDMPVAEYPVNQVLASAKPLTDFTVGVRYDEALAPVWVVCNAYPLPDATGAVMQVVVAFIDVSARKRAQDEQQRVQERLQLVLRGIDEAPWDLDLLSGEVYFSPRWWQMLGYGEHELPATLASWERLRHPDDVAHWDAAIELARNSDADSFQVVYRLQHKAGHCVRVLSRAYISRNAQGQAVRLSGTNTDLTERDLAQAQLQESEHRYRALVEWSPVGIGVHQGGVIVYVNPAAQAMLGARSADELLGTPVIERVHPDYRQQVISRIAASLAAGAPMPLLQEKFLRLDGGVIDVEIQGTVITHQGAPAIQVNFLDVTERKKSEAALRRSELRFRALTELSSDWHWEQDAELRFVAVGERFQAISRLKAGDYLGKARWETSHAGVTEAQWAEHRALLQARLAFHDFELQCPGRDGGWIWVSISGAPVFDEQGNFTGYWGVGRDISEDKRAEQALRENQTQYQALVEWSPLGMSVHQRGQIVYANPAAARFWGAASAQALVGTPIAERFHPRFRASALERIRAIEDKGVNAPLRQSMFLRLDGRAIDVETQGMAIQYRGESAVLISFQDITARKQTETTLRESEERFRILTQLSSDWYWEQDENYRFVLLSGHVAVSTGLTSQEHVGKTRWEIPALNLSEADWERHRQQVFAHEEFRDFEIRRPDVGARMHWASVSGTPMFDANGAFRGYRGIGRDITAQKQAADQIHRLAFYDALTGLPNRRLLLEQLKKALHINARHHLQGALLFIDLDNFKTLNDTLGHDVGDILLQQVSKRLVACVREADTVARLGGDEFVVVLEDLNEVALDAASQADAVGQKILTALAEPYQLAGREHRSTPSIGITLFGAQMQGVDDLLKQADLAMYQAKGAGRNTLRFFDAGMQSEVDSRVALESDLRDGLQGGEELALQFQAVVGADGRVTGAEALVRWQQPVRGLVLPDMFIPLAESTGLILPLGNWVLQAACEQLAVWAGRRETAHLTLAVNVSARQLREPDFVAKVMACLRRTGAAPNRLRLELTESVLADRVDDIIVKMGELKTLGVGFSLDDFGTGYSSLSYLKQLPLDLLKIDRSFVRDVLIDPNDAAIARTIVALGQSLGLSVVAEGVETLEQRDFLASNGCFAYQGYLFGGPMPISEFDALVLRLG